MKATEKLLAELDWKKEDIGVLIYMTQSADYLIPSTAIALQERMGLSKEVIAFDVNLGCSSFGYGVHIAASMMNTMPACKKALCLVADRVADMESKRLLNADTISFSLLTGSAASAVGIEKKQGKQRTDEYIQEHHMAEDKVMVIYLPEVHESIAGIIAGKVREKYHHKFFILK